MRCSTARTGGLNHNDTAVCAGNGTSDGEDIAFRIYHNHFQIFSRNALIAHMTGAAMTF